MKGTIFAEQLFDNDVIETEWEKEGKSYKEYARVLKISMDDTDCFVDLMASSGMHIRRTYDRKDSVEIVD